MEIEKKLLALIGTKRTMIAEMNVHNLRDTEDADEEALERHLLLQKRLQLIDALLLLLNADQKFVVERHLIEEMAWPALTNEYALRWPDAPKVERTLVRKQAEAIAKMMEFTITHMDSIGYLLDEYRVCAMVCGGGGSEISGNCQCFINSHACRVLLYCVQAKRETARRTPEMTRRKKVMPLGKDERM